MFTPFHEEHLNKATELLDKAFDGYVLVLLIEDPIAKQEASRACWRGGRMQAMGLATDFLQRCALDNGHYDEDSK
jgi:hypothetical protein